MANRTNERHPIFGELANLLGRLPECARYIDLESFEFCLGVTQEGNYCQKRPRKQKEEKSLKELLRKFRAKSKWSYKHEFYDQLRTFAELTFCHCHRADPAQRIEQHRRDRLKDGEDSHEDSDSNHNASCSHVSGSGADYEKPRRDTDGDDDSKDADSDGNSSCPYFSDSGAEYKKLRRDTDGEDFTEDVDFDRHSCYSYHMASTAQDARLNSRHAYAASLVQGIDNLAIIDASGRTSSKVVRSTTAAQLTEQNLKHIQSNDNLTPAKLGKVTRPYAGSVRDHSSEIKAICNHPENGKMTFGTVYVLRHDDDSDLFKVGHTARNAEKRRDEICHGKKTQVVYESSEFQGSYQAETIAEKILKHEKLLVTCSDCKRKHKEWYKGPKKTILEAVKDAVEFLQLPAYEHKDGRWRLTARAYDGVVKKLCSFSVSNMSQYLADTRRERRSGQIRRVADHAEAVADDAEAGLDQRRPRGVGGSPSRHVQSTRRRRSSSIYDGSTLVTEESFVREFTEEIDGRRRTTRSTRQKKRFGKPAS